MSGIGRWFALLEGQRLRLIQRNRQLSCAELQRHARWKLKHPHGTEWRSIPEWEGFYEISNGGEVRSLPREIVYGKHTRHWDGKELNPGQNAAGYLYVVLQANKRTARRLVHRLVLEAFVGPCPEGMEACHNDGDPTNNHVSNLRWDTPSANQRDRYVHEKIRSEVVARARQS